MQLTIKKRQIGTSNKFHYEVFADGVKIGERRSDRTYVAAAVCVPGETLVRQWVRTDPDSTHHYNMVPATAFGVWAWIGREDLILKNAEVKAGCKVARLAVEAKEYEK